MKQKKSKNSKNRFFHIDLLLIVLLFVCGFTLWTERDLLFMKKQYEFTSVNNVFFGSDNICYAVDQGKETINIVSRDGTLIRQLHGGSYEKFYYAEAVTAGDDGTLYIADQAYNEDGEKEYRVVSLKDRAYSILFCAAEKNIYEIQNYNGDIYFLCAEAYGLGLYKLKNGEEAELIRPIYTGDVLNGASIDLSTGLVAIAVRRGDVRLLSSNKATWVTVPVDAHHLMPRDVSARNGRVYFTDLYQGRLCCLKEEDIHSVTEVYAAENTQMEFLNASSDGQNVLCADFASYYEISYTDDGRVSAEYIYSVKNKYFWKTVLLWIEAAAAVIILLYELRFLPSFFLHILKKESTLRMTIVVIAVVAVSCFIAWSLLSENYRKENEEDIRAMKLFTDLAIDKLDTDLLKNIEWEYDYQNSAYMKMNAELNGLMERAYEEGKDYYYVLYRVKEGQVRYLMNYYDSILCGEPCFIYTDYYIDSYENGTSYALQTKDVDGLWLFVLSPVKNENGECVALLEIGTDLSYRRREQQSRTVETILSVFCSAAVMMMLIVEALFLMNFLERRRSETSQKPVIAHTIPLRTLSLLSYASTTVQDSFITTLSSKLYTDNLPVSRGVAIGLPLSAELLMMAVFAVIGGRMTARIGTKKTLFIGIFVGISGFIVCASTGSYMGRLLGNILAGSGVGIINVTCSVIAAKGANLEETSEGFADIMAGCASGIAIGAGLASLLYPIGGSRISYTVAACFLVPVIFLVYRSKDLKTGKEKTAEEKQSGGFLKFFFNLRVFGFFALVLVPFMVSISYREYFLPMYIMEKGIPEHRVGQIFLICGLLVLYIGPYISKFMIRRFGTFWSVIISGLIMGANLFLFVIHPSVITAVAGILIMSGITSFAYTCQYTYFEQLPDCAWYGDERAMGVYSIFENLGQTIGPVVYGVLLGFGYQAGLSIMGGILLILVLVYTLLMQMKGMSKFFR